MSKDMGSVMRKAFLEALHERGTKRTLTPEDLTAKVMTRRALSIPKVERQAIFDKAAEEIVEGMLAIAMLGMHPFTDESYDRAFDHMHTVVLAMALKERCKE